ncbi:MAG: hypothetical protein ABFD46_08270 [Armatimonadota bacterium]
MTENKITEETQAAIGVRDQAGSSRWRRNSGATGKGGAPEGNTNALKHGIYADRFLSPEEKPLFDAIIAQLHEDFVFNKSSDFMQVELVAVYFLKLGRAQEAGDWDAAERLDRMIRCHLKDLKATKIAREGEEPKGAETTPAEWATALLEKLAAAENTRSESGSEKTQE